eukprot:GHVN01012727.1.p1 GENE.GHVN01012727.1~~GHVN01012727.1.p1  ORF type:complete len:779 (+),score=88.73 GHVN01012727.1:868-3204(+)
MSYSAVRRDAPPPRQQVPPRRQSRGSERGPPHSRSHPPEPRPIKSERPNRVNPNSTGQSVGSGANGSSSLASGSNAEPRGLFGGRRTLSMLMLDSEDEQPLLMTLPGAGLYGRRRSQTRKNLEGSAPYSPQAQPQEMRRSTSLRGRGFEATETALQGEESQGISNGLRNWTFFVLLTLSVLCNYDHGAIPACLGEIQAELHLSYIRQSLIGNLVYIGFLIGSLTAGVLFQYCNPKNVLVGCACSLFCILAVFSVVKEIYMIYITRFLTGLCQAFPCVFAPVWVTEYSAEGKTNQWVALSQLASILGTTLGYFLGGVLSHLPPLASRTGYVYISTWQTPFVVQALACVPVAIALMFIPKRCLNRISISVNPVAGDNEGGEGNNLTEEGEPRNACAECCVSTFTQWAQFLGQPLYLYLIAAISNLFFVVTGIQFWVTEYMIKHLNYSKMMVVTWTTFTFLTSPVLGVTFGGFLIDKCGGSRGAAQMKKAVRISTLFAFLASALAILCTMVTYEVFFALCLWFMLFFGGALVPTATTLLIHSVPTNLRSHASALTQFAQNLLGYFPAPLISGAVMDGVSNAGYTGSIPLMWGFRFIMYSSVWGLIFVSFANCVDPMDFEEESRSPANKSRKTAVQRGETQLASRSGSTPSQLARSQGLTAPLVAPTHSRSNGYSNLKSPHGGPAPINIPTRFAETGVRAAPQLQRSRSQPRYEHPPQLYNLQPQNKPPQPHYMNHPPLHSTPQPPHSSWSPTPATNYPPQSRLINTPSQPGQINQPYYGPP